MINLAERVVSAIQTRMGLDDFDRVLDMMYGGSPSYTGKLVSPQNALQVSAVWASINVRGDDIASLPFLTYRREGDGRALAKDHYLWNLLRFETNPLMSAFRFKRLMQNWMDLWGNAYAEIETNGRGQVVALWPWRPDRVTIRRAGPMGALTYSYKLSDGTLVGPVPSTSILHLRGLSLDGITGLSPIEYHKNTVGLSMAITEHGGRFFDNGARPLGVLQYPGKLSETAYKNLRDDFEKKHKGLENAHRVAIFEEGLTWKETGVSMVDAQYLETMKFTQEDIAARIFKIPPHRIGLLDRSTNNNIEHQGLEYVQYMLGPLAENWQQEIMFSLLSPREQQSIEVAVNFRRLLRGDHAAMGTFMGQMAQNGLMNDDELREEFLDLNPKPKKQGQFFFKQVNMEPVESLIDPPQPAAVRPQNTPADQAPVGNPNGATEKT